MATVVRAPLVADGHGELAFDEVATRAKFVGHDGLVRRFEQTGAEFAVQVDRGGEYGVHDVVRRVHMARCDAVSRSCHRATKK